MKKNRCPVCGTTEHTIDSKGFVIPDPKPHTIRLKGKAYEKFRLEVWKRAGGRCEICGAWSPLRDRDGVFDVFTSGHISHIKSRGSGGSDTLDNVKWSCFKCHSKHHGPKWSD